MTNLIENIKNKGYKLPEPTLPIANYSPFVFSRNLIFISGQVPIENNNIKFIGKLGKDLDIQEGKEAAELCMLNTFSILNLALDGNLNLIHKCLRLTVYINCVDTFYEQPTVADGASNLIREIFANNGDHTRVAVGANSLPKNSAVEIDSVFELKVE